MRPTTEQEQKIIQALLHAANSVDRAGGTFVFGFIVEQGAPFIARGGDPLMGVSLAEIVKAECIRKSMSNEHEVAKG